VAAAFSRYARRVQGSAFDEVGFFTAIEDSGVRSLLIGRRALIVLGMPVLTADYDLWIHIDDIEALNAAIKPFDLFPNRTPEEARARGRNVLENDEHVDVLVARGRSTKDGALLTFDDAWARKQRHQEAGLRLWLPSIDDLILTKRWAMRPHDLADIQFLEALERSRRS
jgi:hypothetical protein